MATANLSTSQQASDSTQEIAAQLKTIIATDLDVNLALDEIDETVPLLEDGLALDSIILLEFIALIEERFAFEFRDRDLELNNFENLSTLASFVRSRLGEDGRPVASANRAETHER